MKSLVGLTLTGFFFFSLATVVAQAILIGVFWLKGGLTPDKRLRILAVLYDVDFTALRMQAGGGQPTDRGSSDSLESRSQQNNELAIRNTSFRKSFAELLVRENTVQVAQRRDDNRRLDFDALLSRLETEALKQSIQEVRVTLEALPPNQAKEQLIRILDDDGMDDVVSIVESMSQEKRKKILSQFKAPAEAERLHEILRELRSVANEISQDGNNSQRL